MEEYESQVARSNFTWDDYAENLTLFARNTSGNGTYINKFYFYETVQFAVLLVLLVGIVAGNSTVILALLLTKSRKSRMNFFMMQLAIADLWVGLISVPTDMVQRITIVWVAGNWACKLIKFLQGVVTYSSTYVLVALSIDRCDAIRHPMNFTGSWRRARGLIIAAWLLSVAFSLPMLFLFEEKRVQDKLQCWVELESRDVLGRVWVTGVFVSLFIIPALTISACYGIIVVTIRSKSKHALGREPTRKKQPASTAATRQFSDEVDSRRASSRGIIPKAKIKTVKMTFVIVFAFILCWSPYMIFDLLQVYKCIPTTQTSIAIASLVQSLAPLNSAANPIIYCIFSSRVFVSLRNLPPYKWLWCWRDAGGGGTDSRAHTELLTSSHRRTRRDLTITRTKDDSVKHGPGSQKLTYQRGSGRQVRLRLPGDNNYVTQQNNVSQPNDTSLQPSKTSSQINDISSQPNKTSAQPNKTSPLTNKISSQANKASSQPNNTSSASNNTSSQPNKTSSPSNNTSALPQNTSSKTENTSLRQKNTSSPTKNTSSPTNNTSLQPTKSSSPLNISSPNNHTSPGTNYISQNNNVLRNSATQLNNI